MALLRGRRIVPADPWRHVPDGAPLPLGDLIVSLDRWRREKAVLVERGVRLGVRLGPADDPLALEPDLPDLWLVAIEFSVFSEGRGYSQARLLRDRLGFAGEIRAVGDVGRDRVAFMERCGVDAFELRAGEDPAAALAAFDRIGVRYQPASDAAPFAAAQRGLRPAI